MNRAERRRRTWRVIRRRHRPHRWYFDHEQMHRFHKYSGSHGVCWCACWWKAMGNCASAVRPSEQKYLISLEEE